MLTRRFETPGNLLVVRVHNDLTPRDVATLLACRRDVPAVFDLREANLEDHGGLTQTLTQATAIHAAADDDARAAVLADSGSWDIAQMLAARLGNAAVFRDMGGANQWLAEPAPADDYARLQSCFQACAAER